ncbi:carbohydrate ABC transporter permease [Phytohabitans suffuscus]|uniref:Sugar ABC transporter permease n=1 Tax=Phytohabitans suffuscus TaxID=624315 RepID=A0A6F8YZT0_9ACTN|nr:sugar ABC transporter permease [Phytohabitans suffuscus]BCB91331.1 sugar ABC transporter permease [Phytohabitans suffuscus]
MSVRTIAGRLRRPKARPAPPGRAETGLIGYNRAVPYMFSGPAVILVGLILGFPVLYSIYQSLFHAETLADPVRFVGLANYTAVAAEKEFWAALGRSGIFIGGCIVLGQVLAVAFAFVLNRLTKRLRILRAITILPYIVSSVAAAVMFRLFFNTEFGLPNRALALLGIDGMQWLIDPTLAMIVVIVTQVWTDLPLSILVVLAGLQTIDQAHLDAALVDGASGWTRARHITLPLIAPQLALSTVWLSYSCLTSFGVILALTGGGPGTSTQTLPLQMYSMAFQGLDLNRALAIANIILVLNGLLTLVYLQLAKRFGSTD